MLATWTIWAALLTVGFFAVNWLTTPSYKSEEPKPIGHWIPLLGHALDLISDKRIFYKRISTKAGNQPFSIFVGGRKHYVFSKPAEISAVFRNAKTLELGGFVIKIFTTLFALTQKEAIQLRGEKDPIHGINNTYLLKPEMNAETAQKYFAELDKLFNKLDEEIEASPTKTVRKDGLDLVRDVQGKASTIAYFGRTMFEVNPGLLEDLIFFIKNAFWLCFFGLPPIFYPKAAKARARCLEATDVLVDSHPEREDISPFVNKRFKYLKSVGLSTKIVSHDCLALVFGLNSNSLPTAYSALLHLLAEPNLLFTIRHELSTAGYSSLPPSQYIQIIPTQVPHLRALWLENLRYHSTAMTIREVTAPTVLSPTDDTSYHLAPGGVVTVPTCLLHRDETLHPDPNHFCITRFLEKELGGEGEDKSRGLRPFGGGASYCPGRVFAEKQVLGFLAAVAMRYEVRFVESEVVWPDNLDVEYVTNMKTMTLEIGRRRDQENGV